MRNLKYALLTLLVPLAACTNGKVLKKVTTSATSASTGFTHQITSAAEATSTTTTGGNIIRLQIIALNGAGAISNFCGSAGACSCNYTWVYSGVNRFDTQPVSSTGATNAVCAVPLQWLEVPSGVNVTVELTSANNLVRAAPFIFTKGGGTAGMTVDFTDASGQGYRNIVRATVYEQQRVFKTIQSLIKVANKQNSSGGNQQLNVHRSAQFCPGGSTGVDGCEGQQETSSVSNLQIPYNVYFPATTSMPASNDRYLVAAVNESNMYPGDSTFALSPTNFDGAIPIETNSKPTNPLDATTAPNTCRNGPTAGTLTNDRLASQCIGFASPTLTDGSCGVKQFASGAVQMVRLRRFHTIYPLTIQVNGQNTGKVLAQAQAIDTVLVADRVLEHGTPPNQVAIGAYRGPLPCPFSIFDSTGVTGYLYQWNWATGQYETRHGGVPRYVASNDPEWGSGATFDGASYPNFDRFDPQSQRGSCAATIPLFSKGLDRTPTSMQLRTAGLPANRMQIRDGNLSSVCQAGRSLNWKNGGQEGFPGISLGGVNNYKIIGTAFEGTGGAFLPEWEEDTSFKACVLPRMESTGANDATVKIKDPPIHTQLVDTFAPDVPLRNFSSSTTGTLLPSTRTVAAWCAETLPTQNKQIDKLELGIPSSGIRGLVKNYTSHVKKGQVDTTACNARLTSVLPNGYPTSFKAEVPFQGCVAATSVFPAHFDASTQIPSGWANHGTVTFTALYNPDGNPTQTTLDESHTCDKDVNLPFSDFPPLQQDAEDTERSLKQRPNIYGCFVTSGTADYHYKDKGLRTPAMCCSPDVMNTPSPANPSAHFEPGTAETCGYARE